MKQAIEFLGDGQCYICGHPITVVEEETTEITLDPKGLPINFNTLHYNTFGECKNCGKLYPSIEKNNLGFRPVNRLKRLVPSLQITDNNDKINPFGYRR